MSNELRDDWKAADDYTSGDLSLRPKAHLEHVITDIGRLDDFPRIVGPQDRCHTGAEHETPSANITSTSAQLILQSTISNQGLLTRYLLQRS